MTNLSLYPPYIQFFAGADTSPQSRRLLVKDELLHGLMGPPVLGSSIITDYFITSFLRIRLRDARRPVT